MLDARIYRAALVPVLLAIIVCSFSLRDQPAAMSTTLAPDAFSGARATREASALATAFPVRRPGGAGDAALARRVAGEFRSLRPAYEVSTHRFGGETIDGARTLETVMARQVGAPGPELVVVAHRDAAGRGAAAELSGTAAMLELARIVAGGRLRRTITFVSTSGGSGGAAGARDLVHRLSGNPIDAVLVLGDAGSRRPREPVTVSWSDGSELGPPRLRRTVEQAVRDEVATTPGAAGLATQWTRLAFPGTMGEQGPLVAAGLPAVLLSASGERPPPAAAPVDENRVQAYGRAALRTLVALDDGPTLGDAPTRDVVTLRKVLPAWAVRLLVGALLLAPLLVTVDGFARARRRRHPVTPWLAWIGAAAAPFALAAALATVLGLTGLLTAPPAPVAAGTIPVAGAGRAALIATGLVFVLAIVARRVVLRAMGGRTGLEGPGGGAAVLVGWSLLSLLLWIVNPFAAGFMVPAAHLWLLVAAPGVRLRRSVALALVALSLLPFAIGGLILAGQYGYGPLDFAWALVLAVAGAHIGPVAWLFWSLAAGCAIGAFVLAWRTPKPPPPERSGEPRITVRGPVTYAGPGSLGGTESALRR